MKIDIKPIVTTILLGNIVFSSLMNLNAQNTSTSSTPPENQKDDLSSESVIITKTFNPTINDAFKINESPNLDEELQIDKSSKGFDYSIRSVPVASSFNPQKGKAVDLKIKNQPITFDNYVRFSAGMYLGLELDAFLTKNLDRNSKLQAFVQHTSSQNGGISMEGASNFDHSFYDTNLSLGYLRDEKKTPWNTQLNLLHRLYHWYGISDEVSSQLITSQNNELDVSRNFIGVDVQSGMKFSDKMLSSIDGYLSHFRDDYDANENQIVLSSNLRPSLFKQAIDIGLELDYLNGGFKYEHLTTERLHQNLLLKFNPNVRFSLGDFNFKVGATAVNTSDFEASENELDFFPDAEVSYFISGLKASVFTHLKGGVLQNSYRKFAADNEFTAPDLQIIPTKETYRAGLGLAGELASKLDYRVSYEYSELENNPFWVQNEYNPNNNQSFMFENSFGLEYDKLNKSHFNLGVDFKTSDVLVHFNLNVFNYRTQNLAKAWNMPNITSDVMVKLPVLKSFELTSQLFYVGHRYERQPSTSESLKLDSYFDANINLSYKIGKHFDLFVMGHNLISQNYEKWKNFPVQSIQASGGIRYKF